MKNKLLQGSIDGIFVVYIRTSHLTKHITKGMGYKVVDGGGGVKVCEDPKVHSSCQR